VQSRRIIDQWLAREQAPAAASAPAPAAPAAPAPAAGQVAA